MIRQMTSDDIARVGDVWLGASIQAHGFVPADFWRSNYRLMTEELLPQAECYVHVTGGKIDGFSTVAGDFVHCLFVEPESQRLGIGAALLSHLKASHQALRLHVYQQNPGAARFYRSHGFVVTGEATCPHTGCAELVLEWKQEAAPSGQPDRTEGRGS
jgi:putative acetyltransferase